jgi:hypothetical protein
LRRIVKLLFVAGVASNACVKRLVEEQGAVCIRPVARSAVRQLPSTSEAIVPSFCIRHAVLHAHLDAREALHAAAGTALQYELPATAAPGWLWQLTDAQQAPPKPPGPAPLMRSVIAAFSKVAPGDKCQSCEGFAASQLARTSAPPPQYCPAEPPTAGAAVMLVHGVVQFKDGPLTGYGCTSACGVCGVSGCPPRPPFHWPTWNSRIAG